jgi:predicted nucleic acid-binding protein
MPWQRPSASDRRSPVITALFPDNTVLINFGIINRMDLLQQVVNEKGAWCGTVASECAESSRQPNLGALSQAAAIFGTPLLPTPAELIQTRIFRDQLASPGDSSHAHLGEAETLAIVTSRNISAIFVTDDRGARRLASHQSVAVVSTWDLLRAAVRRQLVDEATAWGYVQTLRAAKRGGPPGVYTRAQFSVWLAGIS